MRFRLVAGLAAGLLAVLALPAASDEATQATPPNRNDPCASAGRDTCGTAGIGFYKESRYGQRWWGDFRGAVPGYPHTFCIDLRFWYPSVSYQYREDTSGTLRNREDELVPAERLQRMAYAIWTYGRSSDPNRQAAVMLYVHSLMGDARPGELDPGALNASVASVYTRIARDSALYHGPYLVEIRFGGTIAVSKPASATIRVLSASGHPVPGVELAVSGNGVGGLRPTVTTNGSGVATMGFTPSISSFTLAARAGGLASTLPRVFRPTTAAAGPNGQRIVVPSSQQISAATRSAASKGQIGVSSQAVPTALALGEASSDRVTISGATSGWQGTVAVRIHGPFASLAQIRCDGKPAWQTSFVATGAGTYNTPAVKLPQAGWYTYVLAVPGDASNLGMTTPCAVPAESFRVQAVPKLTTTVSTQRAATGSSIFDTVHLSGLGGVPVIVQAFLYGPFASRDKISCDGQPVWSGTLDVKLDGDYQTTPFVLTAPGYYTYRERIDAGDLVRAVQTACADTAETALAVVHPQLTTEVTSQKAQTGATVADRVTVTGLGALAASVQVELWGPFATTAAIRCTGTPFKLQTLAVSGDGTYTTAPVLLAKAGYYTYRASIAAGPLNDAYTAACGETVETVLVAEPPPPPKTPKPPPKPPKPPPKTTTTTTTTTPKSPPPPPATTTTTTAPKKPPVVAKKPKAKPTFRPTAMTLTTVVSHEVVRPGAAIFDHIRVRGVRAAVQVQLFGPFATRGAIRCSGRPFWTGRVMVRRDGTHRSPAVRVTRAGFYAFRERVLGVGGVARLTTACAIEAETSLGAPKVITGRGDRPRYVPASRVGAITPTRVHVASLGIDAPILPVGIDVTQSVLGVPPSIHTVGWWRDGMAPGAKTGTIVIAGHVDSAVGGAGAFFRLHQAKAGDRVEVRTAGGRTFAYRVVSVRNYLKTALPTGVWSRRGPARLVLVTCGGPFDRVAGHYRDNVVLTAVAV